MKRALFSFIGSTPYYFNFQMKMTHRTFYNLNSMNFRNFGVQKNGVQFTLTSYNILAQDLLDLHPHLYFKCHSEDLLWYNRLEKLSKEILFLKPEILCLQEVQQNHLHMIHENLKNLNYDYVFKKKTGIRTDGCAIFFNKNLFNLMETHKLEFFQPNIEILNRSNIAIFAKLNLKSDPNSLLLIATTHLLYNPRRQDVRLAQVQVLLAELDRLSVIRKRNNEFDRIPIVLAGDFNFEPYSAPYRLLTTGNLYYHNLSTPTLDEINSPYGQSIGNLLLPSRLGITDNCQHIDLIQNGYQGRTRLKNSEELEEQSANINPIEDDVLTKNQNLFSSGRLTHDLNLNSVYSHKTRDNEFECTTFMRKWVTVDYIFYSNSRKNSSSKCNLELLSRYTLPSVRECQAMGAIPNSNLGSDHIALTAKFFLNT